MEDQLITFQTAKLAKERGFDLEVQAMTVGENYPIVFNPQEESPYNWNSRAGYSVPSQSLLQRWIRENYSIHIQLSWEFHMKWFYEINKTPYSESDNIISYYINEGFNTYEDALEDALQHTLKILLWKISWRKM